MEGRVERLYQWAEGRVAPPVKFDLFLTNHCNLLCQFCNYPRLPPPRYEDELSHEEIITLVRQAGEMGAKVLGILGGEPFLRKETCLEAMGLGKRLGMSGSIVTNGTLLTESDMRRILAMGWDLLRFSIDAPEPLLHDSLRGVRGSFNRTLRALEGLQRLKKAAGLSHPTVEINMVLTRSNASSLPGMVGLAQEHAVNRIYVLPVIEFGMDISALKITEREAGSVLSSIEEAEELAASLGVWSNLPAIKKDMLFTRSNEVDTVLLGQENVPCFFPWYGMSIDAQGWLTPCGQIETEPRVNIRDFDSLFDAWTSSYFTALRGQMASRRLPKGCERCCMPLMDENTMLREALKGREFPQRRV